MFQHESTDINYDPTPPDLLLSGEPFYNEFPLFDNLIMPTPSPDLTELTKRIDSLTVEVNTLGLRLEIERTKRQRLQATIKQLRRDRTSLYSDLQILRGEFIQLRDQQTAVNYQLDNQNIKTNTLSFRSVSRIVQILSMLIPNSFVSIETSTELTTLLEELTNTAQHFGVVYMASPI